MSDYQTLLEDESLSLGLQGDHHILADLRNQVTQIQDRTREFTGVGFFTTLSLSSAVQPAKFSGTLGIFGIDGECDQMREGFNIMIWATDGLINTIEGHANGSRWDLRTMPKLYFDSDARASMAKSLNL